MTARDLQNMLNSWLLNKDVGKDISRVNALVECLADHAYDEYEPALGPYPGFWSRLGDWLNNVRQESDKQLLFLLLEYLLFVSSRDFHSLQRTAYASNAVRWIVDQAGIDLLDSGSTSRVQSELSKTWFCPITDSAKINTFYHLNRLEGVGHRPPFDDLQKFGDSSKVEASMSSEGLHRLVLLEDFVGTGSQMGPAVAFAVSLKAANLPVLLCPLLICPTGHKLALELASKHSNLTYDPVHILSEQSFILSSEQAGEPELFHKVRNLVNRIHPKVVGASGSRHTPFGYQNTGALTVLYSNCPDNTLPIVHHVSESWTPLFPRASRL